MDLQNLEISELLEIREEALEVLLRKVSDLRARPEVEEVVKEIIQRFPGCNGLVLKSYYKDETGKEWVYGFDEIECSRLEGSWVDEVGDELRTVNAWIYDNPRCERDPETDNLLTRLSEIYPYPLIEEIDWSGLDNEEKHETLYTIPGGYVQV